MPQIREYTSKTNAPVATNMPKVTADVFGGGIAKGLQQLGNVGMVAAEDWAKREEKRQEFEANKKAMQEKQDITLFLEEQRKKAPAGAEGFTTKVKEELDGRRQKLLDNAESEHQRKALDISLTQIHLGAFQDAQAFEVDSFAKKQRQDLEKIFDTNNNIVRATPSLAEDFVDSEMRLIEKAPLDNTFKAAWANKRKQEIFESAFDGEVSKLETGTGVTSAQVGQYLTSAKQEGGRWIKNTSAEGYQTYIGRLERLQESLKSKEQQQMFTDFDEKMDQLQSTGVRTKENVYTPEWIKANVADPQKREVMLKREAMATNVGAAMNFVKDAPADKINEHISKLEESRKSTGQFHVVDAEFQAVLQAKKNRDNAFVKDPSAYTVGVSPALQKLQNELAENPTPEKADQYASLMAAEQQRLYPGVQPKILNQTEVGRIAAQMSAVSYDEKGAAETVKALQGEMEKWGKWWPHVVRDLKSGKKPALNDSQYVAASLLDKPHLKHLAEDMIKAASQPRKALLKELPEGSEKDVYTSAVSALSDFRKSVGAMPGGEEVSRSYANAITQLALYKQARGEDVDIEGIADQVINDSYSFRDTYRIPNTIGGQAADADIISNGVDEALSGIDESVEFSRLPITSPETSFMKPEDVKRRFVNNLRREGKVYTKGDDSGVRIVDSVGNQVFIKRDGKDVPLEYTWSELQTLGQKREMARRQTRAK
jgi:hypothetical protein